MLAISIIFVFFTPAIHFSSEFFTHHPKIFSSLFYSQLKSPLQPFSLDIHPNNVTLWAPCPISFFRTISALLVTILLSPHYTLTLRQPMYQCYAFYSCHLLMSHHSFECVYSLHKRIYLIMSWLMLMCPWPHSYSALFPLKTSVPCITRIVEGEAASLKKNLS